MPIYMEFEGVTGDVTAGTHKGWIELQSAGFRVQRSSATGSGSERTGTAASMSEIAITMSQDSAGGDLLSKAVTGKSAATVKICFISTQNNVANEYVVWELTNALITSYEISGGGGEVRPVIGMSLNYTKIEWKFHKKPQEGSKSSAPSTGSFDVGKHK